MKSRSSTWTPSIIYSVYIIIYSMLNVFKFYSPKSTVISSYLSPSLFASFALRIHQSDSSRHLFAEGDVPSMIFKKKPGRRFHLFSFLCEVIVQAVADSFGLRVREQLRKMLGTHKPPQQGNDQRPLNRVFFNMIFHFLPNKPFFS